MAFCSFCNDGITKATHIITTADGSCTVPVCYTCMTAFVWGQSEPQAEAVRIPEENDDEGNQVAIRIFFANGRSAVTQVREGTDIEDEIAEWCDWHGVPYHSVADYTVEEEEALS